MGVCILQNGVDRFGTLARLSVFQIRMTLIVKSPQPPPRECKVTA